MKKWDETRKAIANGDTSSAPRDWFESIVDGYETEIEQLQQDKLELLAAIAKKDDALKNCIVEHANQAFVQIAAWRVREALSIQPDDTVLRQYIEPLVKALETVEEYLTPRVSGIPRSRGNTVILPLVREALAAFKGEQK